MLASFQFAFEIDTIFRTMEYISHHAIERSSFIRLASYACVRAYVVYYICYNYSVEKWYDLHERYSRNPLMTG